MEIPSWWRYWSRRGVSRFGTWDASVEGNAYSRTEVRDNQNGKILTVNVARHLQMIVVIRFAKSFTIFGCLLNFDYPARQIKLANKIYIGMFYKDLMPTRFRAGRQKVQFEVTDQPRPLMMPTVRSLTKPGGLAYYRKYCLRHIVITPLKPFVAAALTYCWSGETLIPLGRLKNAAAVYPWLPS